MLSSHVVIFPYNMIENLPNSLAHNSAFNGPDDFKFGRERFHLVLKVIPKFREKLIIISIIIILMVSYENDQYIYIDILNS